MFSDYKQIGSEAQYYLMKQILTSTGDATFVDRINDLPWRLPKDEDQAFIMGQYINASARVTNNFEANLFDWISDDALQGVQYFREKVDQLEYDLARIMFVGTLTLQIAKTNPEGFCYTQLRNKNGFGYINQWITVESFPIQGNPIVFNSIALESIALTTTASAGTNVISLNGVMFILRLAK